MKDEDSLDMLFFELASEDRLNILRELRKVNLKMQEIARKLDLTATESSRQLQRMGKAKLIERLSDGTYTVTRYGRLVLLISSSMDFTFRHRQYFLSHDTHVLPYEFINRLGELNVSSLHEDFISNFAYVEGMMKEAEEYVWAMEEQFHWSAPPVIAEKIRQGVAFRTILPETIVPPPGFRPAAGVERKLLPKVELNLIVTDREAVFGLPNLDGRIDYTQFVSKDERFREWCLDLFKHYWDQGKPLLGSILT